MELCAYVYNFEKYTALEKIVSDWLIASLYPRHFIGPFKNANQTSARALLKKKQKIEDKRKCPGNQDVICGGPAGYHGPSLGPLRS